MSRRRWRICLFGIICLYLVDGSVNICFHPIWNDQTNINKSTTQLTRFMTFKQVHMVSWRFMSVVHVDVSVLCPDQKATCKVMAVGCGIGGLLLGPRCWIPFYGIQLERVGTNHTQMISRTYFETCFFPTILIV